MIASTSNKTDSDHCPDPTADHRPLRSVPSKNKFGNDESNSDSDDFGDFKTAAQTKAVGSEGESREGDQPRKEEFCTSLPCSSLQMNQSPFAMQISRLLDEISGSKFDHFLLSQCQPFADESMANVFSVFAGSNEPSGVEGFALKSLHLWEQICCFEETRLLSIRWDNSRGREFLTNALPMKNPLETADHPKGKAPQRTPPAGIGSSRVQF